MGDFVEEAFAEISEDEVKRIKADSRVQAALRSKKPSIGTLMVGEEAVKFRLSISKRLRRKLSLYKSKIGDTTPGLEETETILYDVLSSLCTEDPWTSWQYWSVYDDSTEDFGAQEVLMLMLKQINSHMEDVKNFR